MTGPDLDTLFGDVRAALDGAPSAERWALLCAALEPVPASEAFDDRLFPYLETHLTRWPDDLRAAPAKWVLQRTLKKKAHLLRLCRALHIARGNLTGLGLGRLLNAWGDQPITRLNLEDCSGLSDDGCRVLADSPHAATIVALNLNLCSIHGAGFTALHELRGPFEEIDLSYNTTEGVGFDPWLERGALDHAHTILLDHSDLTSGTVAALCTRLVRNTHLTHLGLCGASLEYEHAVVLSRLPWPSSLAVLELRYADTTPRALDALATAPSLEGVVKL